MSLRISQSLLSLLICLFLVGCGSFDREWERAVSAQHASPSSTPVGPWTGTWRTATNGHTGNLRAIATPSEKVPGEYKFRYKASFRKVLSARYTTHFPVTKKGNVYWIDGEQKLPFSGTYHHRGRITKDSFKASYSNDKGELGSFSMERP